MNRALDSIRRLPGVAAAGATTAIPFGNNDSDNVILAEGYVMKPGESVISPYRLTVTPRLLRDDEHRPDTRALLRGSRQ